MGIFDFFNKPTEQEKNYDNELVNELNLYRLIIEQLTVSDKKDKLLKQVNSYIQDYQNNKITNIKLQNKLNSIKTELSKIFGITLQDRIDLYKKNRDLKREVFNDAFDDMQLEELIKNQKSHPITNTKVPSENIVGRRT